MNIMDLLSKIIIDIGGTLSYVGTIWIVTDVWPESPTRKSLFSL